MNIPFHKDIRQKYMSSSVRSKDKKVLIALYYYHPYVSGLSICAKRLAESLAARGHQVTVITTQYDTELKQKETINGVTVLRCPVLLKLGKGVISPAFLKKIVELSHEADAVNFHLPMADSGLASLLIPKDKIFSTYQCDINLGKGVVNSTVQSLSNALMKLTLRRSKYVIVSSLDYMRHSVMRGFIGKSIPISPCINTGEFRNEKNVDRLREITGTTDSTFVIGFVGRIVYEKGISYLLDTIPYLKNIPNFKIVIAGDYSNIAGGSIKSKLDTYLHKYPDKIVFTGFLSEEDLKKFYSLMNVLVLPSIDPLEAFGIVQIEAMCCGTPVIATNLPGVRTIIQKTSFGLLVTPKDSKDLAEKILHIYTKKDITPDGFRREEWDTERAADLYEGVFFSKDATHISLDKTV